MGVFANDTFTAPNGTALNGRTADSGGTWAVAPVWGVDVGAIQNNRAYGGSTNSAYLISDLAASANYNVFCDLVYTGFSSINPLGVLGRMDNSGNGYALYRDSTAISILRYTAGTAVVIGTVARSYENCNLELNMLGSSLKAFVIEAASGQYVTSAGATSATRQACISVTDGTHSAMGKAGIRLNNSLSTTRVHIDNFQASEAEIYTESVSTTVTLTQDELVKAYRRPLYFNGSRIARLPDGEFVGGTPPSEFLTVTLTDTADGTYYYYGGLTEDGDWQVNRYLKADVTSKSVATEALNGAYTTLNGAWAARGSLVYA